MNFDFLKNVTVEVPVEVVKEQVSKNPEGLTLRVFSNGNVYPSKELVEAFKLEYTNKDSEFAGNGLDVFLSSNWAGFPKDAPETYLFVSAVDRDQPKVDLFTRTKYNEDGTPLKSVLEQGGGVFGKTLIELVSIAYGIEIPAGGYLDLTVNTDISIPSPTNVHYIPKLVAKGASAGKYEAVRRDNAVINPLIPVLVEDGSCCGECGDEDSCEKQPTSEAITPENTFTEEKEVVAEPVLVGITNPVNAEVPGMPQMPKL